MSAAFPKDLSPGTDSPELVSGEDWIFPVLLSSSNASVIRNLDFNQYH